jgi:hypothetical protein
MVSYSPFRCRRLFLLCRARRRARKVSLSRTQSPGPWRGRKARSILLRVGNPNRIRTTKKTTTTVIPTFMGAPSRFPHAQTEPLKLRKSSRPSNSGGHQK